MNKKGIDTEVRDQKEKLAHPGSEKSEMYLCISVSFIAVSFKTLG